MICGQYELDGPRGSLTHLDTGQSIRKLSADGEAWRFEYRDGDAVVTLAVEVATSSGLAVFVDFNWPKMRCFRHGYGLWRRASFFLLDSLLTWFFAVEGAQQKSGRVELIGGWQNGFWNRSLILRYIAFNSSDARDRADPQSFPLVLGSSDQEPRIWRYVPADPILQEVALHTGPGPRGVPILDQSTPLFRQIAGAPQFARDDGKAFLFHRYVRASFHRGEDYDPRPCYGYVNDSVAFTMEPHRILGVVWLSDPILANPRVEFGEWFSGKGPSFILQPAPALREELTFALIDICRVISEVSSTLPMIREKGRDQNGLHRSFPITPEEERHFQGIRFGRYLDQILGLSLVSPIGRDAIFFIPRFGSRHEH